MYSQSSYPKSSALHTEAKNYLPGGNTRTTVFEKPFPLYASHGKGCHVWDVDGTKRIDCINNYTSMIHGHAHPGIQQAVVKQIERGTCFGMPTESEILLAKELVHRLHSVETVRFTNSGTEAVMMAIKAARAYTGRAKIAKVEGAYHGSYDHAEISLDPDPEHWGKSTPSSVPYAKGTPTSIINDVIVLPFNNPEKATELIALHGKDLAAILIDPLPNRAGLIPASEQFLRAVREAADSVGALVIFDEVISFRLGYGGAQGRFNISPDLTTLGKVIGGGFPVGAVGGKREVMDVFDPTMGKPALPHGGTFTANPVTMQAGLKALEYLDEQAFSYLEQIGDQVRQATNTALERHGVTGVAVGLGSLLKVHFTELTPSDYRSVYPTPSEKAKLRLFNKTLLGNGVLPSGYGLMALSTVMTTEDVRDINNAIDIAVEAVKNAETKNA